MTALDADLAIVGAGPAGLAAARAAADGGVRSVLVIDRDDAPGGLPRYCRHWGFGWGYTHRLESGPAFARRLLAALDPARVRILAATTVQAVAPDLILAILGPGSGAARVRARAVILATGIRERPRAARLVPGRRPERGVLTTGQLQQMVARGVPLGGSRIVVVGTEHVAFSVLLTARHTAGAGHRVVAMVEAGERTQSYGAVAALARHGLGVPIHLGARVVDIAGDACVESVTIEGPGGRTEIPCDAVVFAGDFVPDAPLARASGVAVDPRTGGPEVDQLGRTSRTGVFAAGNLLRAVETSGVAAFEGARAGAAAAAFLRGAIGWEASAPIALADPFSYLVPQRWSAGTGTLAALPPSLRVGADLAAARVVLSLDGQPLWQGRSRRLLRHRRIHLALDALAGRSGAAQVDLAG
ncbi:MAG: FAD-dependent oxidoreductase [Alphaproteobacteria bacterium]|nr:FAD-dependent oxidoreductase [Alphaproteobacteria bacterium]